MSYSDLYNMDNNLFHALYIQATKQEQLSAEKGKNEKMQVEEVVQEAIEEGVL